MLASSVYLFIYVLVVRFTWPDELSMHLGNGFTAGADIMMALDDVVPATANNPERFLEATHRTTRWIDRCIAAHKRYVSLKAHRGVQ